MENQGTRCHSAKAKRRSLCSQYTLVAASEGVEESGQGQQSFTEDRGRCFDIAYEDFAMCSQ
jgi:hypothetical protein